MAFAWFLSPLASNFAVSAACCRRAWGWNMRIMCDLPRRAVAALAVLAALLGGTAATASPSKGKAPISGPAVVVATFDTGTNPFHPCFRRPGLQHPKQRTPGYPATSKPLRLTLGDDYDDSLDASEEVLHGIRPATLYHVPGTNLSFYGGPQAATELVDDYPHGAQASSQIGCEQFGLAPDAQLVILNWYDDPTSQVKLLAWVAAQPWIDVVHLNIQHLPMPLYAAGTSVALGHPEIRRLITTGKLVVIAAGNGTYQPMELTHYNFPRGSLIAGANDNHGYTTFSNLDPHVVMDGVRTVAAAPDSFDTATFGGTSSASPRITGYVARLLADVRRHVGHTGRGLVTIPPGRSRPAAGPLSDARLTAAELHEVVRRTANPEPHASRFDGEAGTAIPQVNGLPFAFYPKMGYGEVSEHTLPSALAVLLGRQAMPERPHEDRFYAASESLRQ